MRRNTHIYVYYLEIHKCKSNTHHKCVFIPKLYNLQM